MTNLKREDCIRSVATLMSEELNNPNLLKEVEEELIKKKQEKSSFSADESVDPVTLGLIFAGTGLVIQLAAFIVQIVSFAVQIRDKRRQESKLLPQEEEYNLMLRQKIPMEANRRATPEQKQQIKRIIQITVIEIREQENI